MKRNRLGNSFSDYLGRDGGAGRCRSRLGIHKEEVQIEVVLVAAEDSQKLQPHRNEQWEVVELGRQLGGKMKTVKMCLLQVSGVEVGRYKNFLSLQIKTINLIKISRTWGAPG